jgi:serine protease Do
MLHSLPASWRAALGALAFTVSLVAAPAAHAQGRAGLPDFTDLYEKQGPAVVSIDVTQKIKRPRMPEISEDDPFYEFFRRFGQIPRGGGGGRGGPERE